MVLTGTSGEIYRLNLPAGPSVIVVSNSLARPSQLPLTRHPRVRKHSSTSSVTRRGSGNPLQAPFSRSEMLSMMVSSQLGRRKPTGGSLTES
jgi:hypothetical protein